MAGSSSQPRPTGPRMSLSSVRRRPSSGRSRNRSRPSGHAGEGPHSRGEETVEPSARISCASIRSSRVWPSRITRAPASRAASASRAWRARRAAAGRPAMGLSPVHCSALKGTPRLRAVRPAIWVHVRLVGCSRWSTQSAISGRPACSAQARAASSRARESPPPEKATARGTVENRSRRRSRAARTGSGRLADETAMSWWLTRTWRRRGPRRPWPLPGAARRDSGGRTRRGCGRRPSACSGR